jgi:hypothetical protein
MEVIKMSIDISKTYTRAFGNGWTQPFRIIRFVRGSNTRGYIEVYEKSRKRWKTKTQIYDLPEIILEDLS